MLNLRENIKRLHLNQHQIEINMSAIITNILLYGKLLQALQIG
jgi:hypothetical protein